MWPQHQHAAAAYVLNEVRAYAAESPGPDRPTPSPAQCTITEAELGHLRYLGGRCIAMSKHATVTRLRRHMYKRVDLFSEEKSKLHLLCKLLRSECEIKNTTSIPSSLTVTDTKQNTDRSLVNISDEALSFFELLHNSLCQLPA